MLRGQLWASSDIELVNQSLMQGFKVIFLGDPISIDPMYKNHFVMASSFVPDYNMMSVLIEGNTNNFMHMYVESLGSKAAMEMMTAILAALFKGTNILFYIPKEAVDLKYGQLLLEYIEYNYGIRTQTKSTMFGFNPKYLGKIVELLYLSNLVTAQEFLINTDNLDQISLRKLVSELHPMVEDPTNLDQIIAWFNNYKDQIIKANQPLINGIQYGGKDSDYACYL